MQWNKRHSEWLKRTAVLALSAGLAAGCSGGEDGAPGANSPAAGTTAAVATATPAKPLSLSYWVGLPGAAARSLKDYNDSVFFKELEKRTGVSVKFQHPAASSGNEQFNLLIASGNLPDVIEYNFTTYSGGPEKAIADKVIIPLNDIIDKHAPNLKKYLDENPEMRKELSTDNGNLYVFPGIGTGTTNVTSGMMLRADWLDELGLQPPETIDEWTHVLREFKTKKGAQTPVTFVLGDFDQERLNGAYGVGIGFYIDNGKVKYGPAEPGYKDYLALLNSWYKEGLMDPDFATQDGNSKNAKATNGSAGAFPGAIGGAMGTYLNAVKSSNPDYDLVAAQHPVLKKGDEPFIFHAAYNYRGEGSAAITPANKHPEETAEWLDYLYSKEGHVLKSFGVEGLTFNWEGDFPRYTDLIVKNPDGLSISDAMSKYLRVAIPSPGFVGDNAYFEQYYAYDQQKEASSIYNKYYKNLEGVRLPRITETPEDGQELSAIMAEINTYRSEMFLKFVMGGESIDNFDKYTAQLKSMKLERAIQIKQAALERYNKR